MTQVSLDTVSVGRGGVTTQTVLSWSHTVAASANGLSVALDAVTGSSGNRFATGVTYNSVAMSSVTSGSVVASLSGQTLISELWYLANPTTGANTISATFGNSVRCNGFGVSVIGASGTSSIGAPASATGNGTTASINAISANGVNDFIVATAATNGNGSGGPTLSVTANGQTLSAWTGTGTAGQDAIGGVDTAQAVGVTSGMSIVLSSSRSWIMTGIAILAAGGAPAGPTVGSFYYYRRHRTS